MDRLVADIGCGAVRLTKAIHVKTATLAGGNWTAFLVAGPTLEDMVADTQGAALLKLALWVREGLRSEISHDEAMALRLEGE